MDGTVEETAVTNSLIHAKNGTWCHASPSALQTVTADPVQEAFSPCFMETVDANVGEDGIHHRADSG